MATFSYTPSFPATETTTPLVNVVRLGDGYEMRQQVGLQREPSEWSLVFSNRDDTDRDNILTFLLDKKGAEAFEWTPPRGSAGKYVCDDWTVEMTQFGRTTINTTFRQVFEP